MAKDKYQEGKFCKNNHVIRNELKDWTAKQCTCNHKNGADTCYRCHLEKNHMNKYSGEKSGDDKKVAPPNPL